MVKPAKVGVHILLEAVNGKMVPRVRHGMVPANNQSGHFHAVLDEDGDWAPVYTQRYDYVGDFHDNGEGVLLAQAQEDFETLSINNPNRDAGCHCFHIKLNGEPAYRERYAEVGDFHQGVTWARTRDQRVGIISADGSTIVDFKPATSFAYRRDSDAWVNSTTGDPVPTPARQEIDDPGVGEVPF